MKVITAKIGHNIYVITYVIFGGFYEIFNLCHLQNYYSLTDKCSRDTTTESLIKISLGTHKQNKHLNFSQGGPLCVCISKEK